MQRLFNPTRYLSTLCYRLAMAAAVMTLGASFLSTSARAEVIAEGDVDPDEDPDLPIFGGTVDGPIIVGVTDIGRLVIDVPAFTDPLISQGADADNPAMIIGQEDTAIGEVIITGFGSIWEAQGSAIVGDRGLAFLSLVGGARFISSDQQDTGDPPAPIPGTAVMVMGNESTSSAITVIDGFGSRLTASYLLVGREGEAVVDIINRGNMITTFDAAIGVTRPIEYENIDDFPDLPTLSEITEFPRPSGRVNVTGQGSRWTIQDSLVIGNTGDEDETGLGILYIADQAVVQVGNQEIDDSLLVNRYGRIELAGGTLRTLTGDVNDPDPLLNFGVIKGDGVIDGSMIIGPLTGELRNAAGVANLRETLLVTGAVDNFNVIESLGGEMEFLAPVNNTTEGDMIFRDAVVRFQDGLTNDGELALGGDTTVYGDIATANTFIVLPESSIVIRGNLTLNVGAIATFTVGDATGTLDLIGGADLTNGILSLDYSGSGVKSLPGDSYDILTASEGLTGTFINTQAVADGRFWDITYSFDTVTVTATGLAAVPIGADFNADGIVDQLDMQIWQDNYGRTSPPDLSEFGDADGDGDVDGRDFLKIQRDFGGPPTPLVAAIGGNVTAVPEPTGAMLLLAGVIGFACRRQK
jgi:T5SS/PEP-CTERM-associated repeat protein